MFYHRQENQDSQIQLFLSLSLSPRNKNKNKKRKKKKRKTKRLYRSPWLLFIFMVLKYFPCNHLIQPLDTFFFHFLIQYANIWKYSQRNVLFLKCQLLSKSTSYLRNFPPIFVDTTKGFCHQYKERMSTIIPSPALQSTMPARSSYRTYIRVYFLKLEMLLASF